MAVKEGWNESKVVKAKYLPKISAGGITWLEISEELPHHVQYGVAWNGTRYVLIPVRPDTNP
jgi:hypothetical protein